MTAETPEDYYAFLMDQIWTCPMSHVESSFVLKERKTFGPFVF